MVGTLAGDSVCDSDSLMKIGICALLLGVCDFPSIHLVNTKLMLLR